MKRKIRRCVFETNSSSSHTLTIAGGALDIADVLPGRYRGDDEVVRIYDGYFGWGPASYNDAATKAAYCYTYAKLLKQYGRNSTGTERIAMLRRVVQETTGRMVEFVDTGDFDIDHQSIEGKGGHGEKIFESDDAMRQFIFNRRSELVIDNDNH